jgi:hypothetical protein
MVNDFRYKIEPKKESVILINEYIQVFSNGKGFVPRLSIIDLIFNMGPVTDEYL